jgi:hypothetical protein
MVTVIHGFSLIVLAIFMWDRLPAHLREMAIPQQEEAGVVQEDFGLLLTTLTTDLM